MSKQPKIDWDPITGTTTYTIYYKNMSFEGIAHCHPDDADMSSQLTGTAIAEARATIAYLRYLRDNDLRPQLKSANQLYHAMNRSKRYNRKSYENVMLQRHIHNLEMDIDAVNEELVLIKQHLKTYLDEKEKVYQYLRKKAADKDN